VIRIYLLAVSLLVLVFGALVQSGLSAAAPHQSTAGLVKVAKIGTLGNVLVTPKGFALYQWHQEKKNQIKCTGACAKAWPPLLVSKGMTVAKHIGGARGTFGVIMRPNGTHQLTYQGKALYSYQGDTKPGEALCQAVEGWYVFPAH
jgi:predicted lipoprotein with Yx(FWY)xxD motif